MSNKYYITDGMCVWEQSVLNVDIGTNDIDEQGFCRPEHNRGVACGITDCGELTLWVTTNGDPVAIIEEDLMWAYMLGDNDETVAERVVTGAGRLEDAVKKVGEIFASDAAHEEALEWYRDQIKWVRARTSEEIENWDLDN